MHRKYLFQSRFLTGIIECVLILLCTVLLFYVLRDVQLQKEAELDTVENIVNLHMEHIDSIFTKVDLIQNMICSPNTPYIDMLMAYSGERLADYHAYTRLTRQFSNELSVIFAGALDSYRALWLVSDQLPITNMFAYPNITASETDLMPTQEKKVNFARLSLFLDEPYIQDAVLQDGYRYIRLEDYPAAVFAVMHIVSHQAQPSASFQVESHDLGVLLIGLDFTQIFQQAAANTYLANMQYCILNAANEVLAASSDSIDYAAYASAQPKEVVNGNIVFVYDGFGGARYIVLVPQRNINPVSSISIIFVAIGLGMLILTGLITTHVVSSSFVTPITTYLEAIRTHVHDEIPEILYRDYRNSIKVLFVQYNQHIRQINQMLADIQSHEKDEYRIELRLLQAQINPHFIYNTLNSICYRELLHGETETADILDDMSTIIRYSFREPERLVPLSEELSLLQRYLRIEKFCADIPIHFTQDISPECAVVQVPKVLLQPLVENALLYGRSARDTEIRLHLSAEIAENVLTLRLMDSGKDADMDKLNLHMKANILDENVKGIGTINVHLRLCRRFGPEYGLRFERSADGYTTAVLRIPALAALPPAS